MRAPSVRPPTPRRAIGDLAEAAVARHLAAQGWTILARNVRVGRSEIDIVAHDPDGSLVFVEIRSRTSPDLGMPEESVGADKVGRLYVAAWALLRVGQLPDGAPLDVTAPFRIDLVSVVRRTRGGWTLRQHLRGLAPP
jgi:putative endonuclease